LDRLVAVKEYQHRLSDDDRLRVLRGAAAAGRLSDETGIATVYDAGTLPDGRPYLIMELCPGGSLTPWLEPENRPTHERVRQVGVRIADALAAAHASGVRHGSVKPANILIDTYGNIQLADFGMEGLTSTEAPVPEPLRSTLAYAPPEAFRLQAPTESGDVYSLAATLYALLAGRPPRHPATVPATSEQMTDPAANPIDLLPDVNWYLMAELMAAMDDDPAARPSAADFRDRLAAVPALRTEERAPLRHAAEHALLSRHRRHAQVNGHPATSTGPSNPGAAVPVARGEPPAPEEVTSALTHRGRGRRRAGMLALAAGLVTVTASVASWVSDEPSASSGGPAISGGLATPADTRTTGGPPPSAAQSAATDTPQPRTTTKPTVGEPSSPAPPEEKAIRFVTPADSTRPFHAVRIEGTYRGGADTVLRVLRWQGGSWLPFPLPAKTDQSGRFTTYVEFGQPGRYRLRVADPYSGVKSEPFVLVVKS
jgi:hypothetical protein